MAILSFLKIFLKLKLNLIFDCWLISKWNSWTQFKRVFLLDFLSRKNFSEPNFPCQNFVPTKNFPTWKISVFFSLQKFELFQTPKTLISSQNINNFLICKCDFRRKVCDIVGVGAVLHGKWWSIKGEKWPGDWIEAAVNLCGANNGTVSCHSFHFKYVPTFYFFSICVDLSFTGF